MPDAKPTMTCATCHQSKSFSQKAWKAFERESGQRSDEQTQLTVALNRLVVDGEQVIDVDHAEVLGPAMQQALGATLAGQLAEYPGLQRVSKVGRRVVEEWASRGSTETQAVARLMGLFIDRLATPNQVQLRWDQLPDHGDFLVIAAADSETQVKSWHWDSVVSTQDIMLAHAAQTEPRYAPAVPASEVRVAGPTDASAAEAASPCPESASPSGGLLRVAGCVPLTREAVASLARAHGMPDVDSKGRDRMHRNVRNRLRKKVANRRVERLGKVGDGGYGAQARCNQMRKDRGLSVSLKPRTPIYKQEDVLAAMAPEIDAATSGDDEEEDVSSTGFELRDAEDDVL
jgi:hypothetical protein